MHKLIPTLAACALAAVAAPAAASKATVKCELKFTLSGWSVLYKRSDGTGTISCSNGQRMDVILKARGGGLSVGKQTIDEGRGEFSAVHDIGDLLGSYAAAEAHAGAVKSREARVVTKGEVTLGLYGKGRGWDLGLALSSFTIEKR